MRRLGRTVRSGEEIQSTQNNNKEREKKIGNSDSAGNDKVGALTNDNCPLQKTGN